MWGIGVNLIDFLVIAVLAVALGLAIRGMVRNRRQGRHGCGCDCGSCMAKCDRREK